MADLLLLASCHCRLAATSHQSPTLHFLTAVSGLSPFKTQGQIFCFTRPKPELTILLPIFTRSILQIFSRCCLVTTSAQKKPSVLQNKWSKSLCRERRQEYSQHRWVVLHLWMQQQPAGSSMCACACVIYSCLNKPLNSWYHYSGINALFHLFKVN